MNYYSHHIGDYKAKTDFLTNDQDLCYRRLMEMYYKTELPIPNETQTVSIRLRVETECLEFVLKFFFTLEKDGWHNKRCDEEIAEYQKKCEKNRGNGKKGGRPKVDPNRVNGSQNNPVGSQSVASRNPSESQNNLNQEPVTSNQEPIRKEPLTPKGGVAKATRSLAMPEIPASLDSELFRAAWDSFSAHRIEKRCKMTPTMANKLLEKLVTYGQWTAIQAINASIENGWQGVFPEKIVTNGATPSPNATPPQYDKDGVIIDRMGW
jgi:uncharacterized protein YdaU (DUF1376 family)